MGLIRSRIHQFINKDLMKELKDICTDVLESNNNVKVAKIREALDKHEVPYNELGPGTNRMAVLIDGYVFKIAMDKWGVRDNDNEFAMTEVLQPFVINVYETNGLISVSEYVTLISREEFAEKKNDILKILHTLSQGFLLGDVGYHPKNFTNWGYRTNGDLVILDFAYIYNIIGDELMCPKDGNLLNYDENFHNLRCPYCKKKYTFMDVRRKVTREREDTEIKLAKDAAYAVVSEVTLFEDTEEDPEIVQVRREEPEMSKEFSNEEKDELFEDILEMFDSPDKYNQVKETVVEKEPKVEPEPEGEGELEDVVSLMDKVYHDEDGNPIEPETSDGEEDEKEPVNPLEVFLAANGYHEETKEDEESSVEVTVKETTEVTVKVRDNKPEVQEAIIIEEPKQEEEEVKPEPPLVEVAVKMNPETMEIKDVDINEVQEEEQEQTSEEEEPVEHTEQVSFSFKEDVTETFEEHIEEEEEEKPLEIKESKSVRLTSFSFKDDVFEDAQEATEEVTIEEAPTEAQAYTGKATETRTSIRRLTPSNSDKPIIQKETVVREVEVTSETTEEENDLFAAAIQNARRVADDLLSEEEENKPQEDLSKYEEMAENHLGHDPYEY